MPKAESKNTKARYWGAILYPENMIDNWQDEIYDRLQIPFAYCVHDKDTNKDGTPRKVHVHLLLAKNNTTTLKAILTLVNTLSKEGCKCCSTAEAVVNVRHAYDYLVHDTEGAKKQGKYQYERKELVTGNNFDIGAYEQLTLVDQQKMRQELVLDITEKCFANYLDFYLYVLSNYDSQYEEYIASHTAFFTAITKSVYQKMKYEQERKDPGNR